MRAVILLLALSQAASGAEDPSTRKKFVVEEGKHDTLKCKHHQDDDDDAFPDDVRQASVPEGWVWGVGFCKVDATPCPKGQVDEDNYVYVGEVNAAADHHSFGSQYDECVDLCKTRASDQGVSFNIAQVNICDQYDQMACYCMQGAHPAETKIKDAGGLVMYQYGRLACPSGTKDFGEHGGCGCINDLPGTRTGAGFWHKSGKPDKTCYNIAKDPSTQCSKKNDDGESAFEGCADTCTPQDSTSWVKKGSTKGNGCAYIAKHPNQCDKKGEDGVHAYDACPRACGCPSARDYVIKHKLKPPPTLTTQLAAKLGDAAEGSVAVRVPTLVAVCVLAGVALGGLMTRLAMTAKEPTEHEPLLAVAKTKSFGV